jgi:hypothetical protein
MFRQPRSRRIAVRHTRFFEVTTPLPWLCVALGGLLGTGCDGELTTTNTPRPQTRAPGIAGIAVGDELERPAAPAAAARPAPAKVQPPADPQFIVGRRTQKIENAQAEIQQGGARAVAPKILAKDPITLSGNAYVFAIGKTAQMNIDHAIDLYKATNDRYPKDYDEFINEIIKANNISLPQLPYYQKYGYDDQTHKLIILEYPHE